MNFYNDNNHAAAAWMRELAQRGHIPAGTVDARSIALIGPADLREFTQCHFFAGVGGWSLALRRAGWPAGRPVWTGSCPCQPFSAAGKQLGTADERHLWPEFYRLIKECRPPVIFGEQVASKSAEAWLDTVQAELEAVGYAFGAIPFPAAGVGAPHLRDRLYWVADRLADTHRGRTGERGKSGGEEGEGISPGALADGRSVPGDVADTDLGAGRQECADRAGIDERNRAGQVAGSGRDGVPVGVGDADDPRSQGHAGDGGAEGRQGPGGSAAEAGVSGGLADALSGFVPQAGPRPDGRAGQPGATEESFLPGPTNGFWADADWLRCRDGRWRPAQRSIFPLVAGLPKGVGRGSDRGVPVDADATQEGRLHRLRGYGNSINIEAAVAFIQAYLER